MWHLVFQTTSIDPQKAVPGDLPFSVFKSVIQPSGSAKRARIPDSSILFIGSTLTFMEQDIKWTAKQKHLCQMSMFGYVWLDMVVYSHIVCKNNGLLECIAVNCHQPGEHD